MRYLLAALLAVCLASGVTPSTAATSAAAPGTRNHFVTNVGTPGPASKVGFNVFDIGPSEVASLPRGSRGLVWLGQKCPTRADDGFRRTVRRLAKNPKVFGYYLSDEPHVHDCPGGPAALATRARFIRQASGGEQLSFIVLDDSFKAFRPAVTGVSMVGVDAYPCSTLHPTCDLHVINEHVSRALRGGIPRAAIVPVYQTFGQEGTTDHYYNLPSARQLRGIMARWAQLVPHPRMDYAYSWGHQGSANPTLRDSAELRSVLRSVFG